jgi:very-short-patch-repair endonuclease
MFTTADAVSRGLSEDTLRWGEHVGKWRRIERGVYGEGPDDPTPVDRAVATVIAARGVASWHLAGVLYGLDSVRLRTPYLTVPPGGDGHRAGARRRILAADRITLVEGIRCTDGLQTMLDLSAVLDDLVWEQVLESALRKRLVHVADLSPPPSGVRGVARIRRVLARRPPGAPPTESLLETLMVQLARRIPGLPPPVRQHKVFDRYGRFVARVDLAWPELGLFIELDGQRHKDQPVYDASRETAVVATTGWLCGRFTWTEVAGFPNSTVRRLAAIVDQARRRPQPRDTTQ